MSLTQSHHTRISNMLWRPLTRFTRTTKPWIPIQLEFSRVKTESYIRLEYQSGLHIPQ
jgi:hypothetical protein